MGNDSVAIATLMGVSALVCTALTFVCYALGPRKNTPYKQAPYECGVQPLGDALERFPIKFYLIAILFVLFDIEVVFLWGWLAVFKDSGIEFKLFSFGEVIVYLSTWILGYIYVVKVGAIDWDETTSLAPEKLGMDKAS